MKRLVFFAMPTVILLLLAASNVPLTFAQGRMNDKDVESLMNNLKDDAKKFKSVFDSQVGKSTIRKTSQEKDAKSLVEQFQKQTENMSHQFGSSKKADQSLPPVLASADRIDKLLTTTPMGDQTAGAWSKVKTELSTLSQQFDVTPVAAK